jgi:hypothetical protein
VSILILLDEMPEIIGRAEISNDKNIKNIKINNLENSVIKILLMIRIILQEILYFIQ